MQFCEMSRKKYVEEFFYAIVRDNTKKAIDMLEKKLVDINELWKNNITPLHTACDVGNYELAKYLIEHGANVNAKDANGFAPIHNVCYWCSSLKVLKLLVENGANINETANNDWTPLYLASNQKLDFVKFLVENGASVNFQDKKGNTPLHNAYMGFYEGRGPKTEIVDYLKKHGANEKLKNNEGKTPKEVENIKTIDEEL